MELRKRKSSIGDTKSSKLSVECEKNSGTKASKNEERGSTSKSQEVNQTSKLTSKDEKFDGKKKSMEKKSKLNPKSDDISKKPKQKVDFPVVPPLKYESLGSGPQTLPSTGKMYIGCHVSAAGGAYNCFENGRLCNADSVALFLRNQRSWNAKPLDEQSIEKWNKCKGDFPPHLILPHGSYLMNLGSPKPDILQKSRNLFVEELKRCEILGIPHFNFHPGSTLGQISREECCKTISESINLAHTETKNVICVIENMSKQGYTVGGDLHEIRLIIEGVQDRSRVGVCIDTCHAHAAGYDLSTQEGFDALVSDFEKIIGWQFLRGMHINDSKGYVGDRKDRHEVIGKGYIGIKGFKRIMNYPRFCDIPLILETPFVSDEGYAEEIKLLRSLII